MTLPGSPSGPSVVTAPLPLVYGMISLGLVAGVQAGKDLTCPNPRPRYWYPYLKVSIACGARFVHPAWLISDF